MGKQNASRTGLFLIELILSIFFFIVSAAVVLQLFVNSHVITEETVSINNALLYSQNMSEVFLANGGDFNDVINLYEGQIADIPEVTGRMMLLLFDKDWNPVTTSTDAKYSILADFDDNGTFSYLNIYVNNYSDNLTDYIISGEYKTELLYSQYIYNQEVKKYNGY